MIKTLQDKKHLWPCADKRQRCEALLQESGKKKSFLGKIIVNSAWFKSIFFILTMAEIPKNKLLEYLW